MATEFLWERGCLVSSNKTKEGQQKTQQPKNDFSRRTFLQGVGVGTTAVGAGVLTTEAKADHHGAKVHGPGAVPITLTVNGKARKVSVEPRVTLLDALRDRLDYTGAKKVCDRATCGSCTVMLDGKAVYACSVLAIEAQERDIQTVEGLASGDNLHAVQSYFVENDAQQCGFCTPGFVVACKAFLDHNPNPTMADVERGLSGNICRCGTYVGVRQAALDAARELKGVQRGD